MAQTPNKHRDTPRISEAREQRNIAIYEAHMRGNSVRAICDDFGIKSTQTAHLAITKGKELVIERGIDIEERRIDIDRMFKNTLGLLAKTAEQQFFEGQIETIQGPDGTITKTKKGIDPRIAGELSRSLNRWAEFCGLLDRAPEVNQVVFNTAAFQGLVGAEPEQLPPAPPAVDVEVTQSD